MSEFVEVKTSELCRYALDWAVAQAEGLKAAVYPGEPYYVFIDSPGFGCGPYHPHEYWAQGGLLITKYQIDLTFERVGIIYAYPCKDDGLPIIPASGCDQYGYYGPTHLIAACRAIVASVLGDTVSVPKELMA